MSMGLFETLGMAIIPESRLYPPEPHYITVSCGHEIYDGEKMVEWNGKWICEECFRDKVMAQGVEELARVFNSEVQTVESRGN